MKYINAIFGIFIIINAILIINTKRAFEIGVIISTVSSAMMLINIIGCWKLYKNNNKDEFVKSVAMIFVCLLLVILGLLAVYNELHYLDILNHLERIWIK